MFPVCSGRVLTEAANGAILTYQYDQAGDRTRLTWPDNVYAGYSYDALDRISQISENGAASGVGLR